MSCSDDETILILIQQKEISDYWEIVNPFLCKWFEVDATSEFYDMGDLRRLVEDGTMQLWLFYNVSDQKPVGCMLTEMIDFPKKRILHIFLLSVDFFHEIAHLIKDLSAWAKSFGCSYVELDGRLGWERVLKGHGFKKLNVSLRKRI